MKPLFSTRNSRSASHAERLWGAEIGAKKLALAVVLIRRSCSRLHGGENDDA